ncbi:YbhB/YbcL family Raf kinase inhibitor-like protein [Dyella silvae]|uniref:YbhB/YbcL family Raf kinase inhibitor-like protein n=1 Tax=Dyella silvae TaxID=2994424 RepID=UPI002263FBED|nr:YbhB/YbcL family Raf kinase inhibitor-like protein [Dyella silvae]
MRRVATLLSTTLFAFTAHAADFSLQVDGDHGRLPASSSYHGYGCTGDNRAPAVHWQNAPAGTRGFALTVFDPDAPTGKGWWHWAVINLPASTTSLPAGAALPTGAVTLRNDYGDTGWGGPCPPPGDPPHHYVFTLFALDVPGLDAPSGATAAWVEGAIRGHALGKAQTTLTYGR